jgi:hypothetical protein
MSDELRYRVAQTSVSKIAFVSPAEVCSDRFDNNLSMS